VEARPKIGDVVRLAHGCYAKIIYVCASGRSIVAENKDRYCHVCWRRLKHGVYNRRKWVIPISKLRKWMENTWIELEEG